MVRAGATRTGPGERDLDHVRVNGRLGQGRPTCAVASPSSRPASRRGARAALRRPLPRTRADGSWPDSRPRATGGLRAYAGVVSQSVYIASPEDDRQVDGGFRSARSPRSPPIRSPGVPPRRALDVHAMTGRAVDLLIRHPAVDQDYDDAIADHELVLSDPDAAHERILARHRGTAERYSVLVVLGSDYDDLANPTGASPSTPRSPPTWGAPVVVLRAGPQPGPDRGARGGRRRRVRRLTMRCRWPSSSTAPSASLDAVREAVSAKVPRRAGLRDPGEPGDHGADGAGAEGRGGRLAADGQSRAARASPWARSSRR